MENANHNITSIRISKKTLQQLHQLAKYDDSMDTLLSKIVAFYSKFHSTKLRNSQGQFTKRGE